ncbi:hypothetical protein BT63DRAFT_422366, partial [Microthyrium microscopicum]
MCDGPDLFLCILSVLFPPIGVWVKRGICSAAAFINLALCILGYLPGLLHAWYIISKFPDPGYEPVDSEESRVQYYYVSGGPPPPSAGPTAGAHSTPQASYGTLRGSAKPQNQTTTVTTPNPQANGGSSRAPSEATPAPKPSKVQEARIDAEGAGPSDGAPPPSYSEVVKGDNKIQSH